MPLPPEQNAFLSRAIYEPRFTNEVILSDSREYMVRYVSPPSSTDYQGMVVQDMSTLQLVVANAGTDFKNPHDVMADVSMGMMGASTQWPEAAATLRAALHIASDEGIPLNQISATGHSLGGTHAQLQAVEAGIHAETFNAFGAERLSHVLRQDPEAVRLAESQVINHRMYHDPVSPLAAQIGRTVDYMDRQDYERHRAGGLHRSAEDTLAVLSAHQMRNFWDVRNNQPGEVLTHNYLHDLNRSPLQERPNGLPLGPSLRDFRWGGMPDPHLRPPAHHASDAHLFDHMVAAMKSGDERAFWQSVATVADSASNREFRAQAVERVDTQDREMALALQVQQAQEQVASMQRHAPSHGFSR